MWYEHSLNPKAVASIFGKDEPSLRNALLYKVNLDANSPEVHLNFDIENFPSKPPVKWIDNGYNTAQAWIKLTDVTTIKIEGWSNINKVEIEIKQLEDNLFYLSAIGVRCQIEVTFKWMEVSIAGYINNPDGDAGNE